MAADDDLAEFDMSEDEFDAFMERARPAELVHPAGTKSGRLLNEHLTAFDHGRAQLVPRDASDNLSFAVPSTA